MAIALGEETILKNLQRRQQAIRRIASTISTAVLTHQQRI
jgi:hypothetical protein